MSEVKNAPSPHVGPPTQTVTAQRTTSPNEIRRRNVFVRFWSFLASKLGFRKLSNFTGFFLLGGALLGFCLARLQFLNPRVYATAFSPGENYRWDSGSGKVGMLLHLGTILPCGILTIVQFIPLIRQRYLLVHRINGHVVLLLLAAGVAGALIITRHTFGGDISTQGAMYSLAILVVGSASLGYYNIKKKQIEQHRKWMMRTAVYMSSIITLRIILVISATIITRIGGYYTAWTCEEIAYTLGNDLVAIAQRGSLDCVNATDPYKLVLVPANFYRPPVQLGSAFRACFGNATWIAIIIHVVGLELYFHLQLAETARLRAISYQKQMEAGAKHPGSAGLISDRLGDAPPYRPEK